MFETDWYIIDDTENQRQLMKEQRKDESELVDTFLQEDAVRVLQASSTRRTLAKTVLHTDQNT